MLEGLGARKARGGGDFYSKLLGQITVTAKYMTQHIN